MDERLFPIQQATNWKKDKDHRPIERNPQTSIPWWLAVEAYEEYARIFGTDQSLERLAERGGFGRKELIYLLSKKKINIL